MNPVWPLSPQKDASYYLLHMTPHGKSRAVYIALLQQPPDCLMLVFFSVMNTLSKGWHLRLSMLEINDRSAVITFKHLLSSCLCRMSILQQYHNNMAALRTTALLAALCRQATRWSQQVTKLSFSTKVCSQHPFMNLKTMFRNLVFCCWIHDWSFQFVRLIYNFWVTTECSRTTNQSESRILN